MSIVSNTLAELIRAKKEVNALIDKAEETGFELSAADFECPVEKLSDDELAAVSGSSDASCACAMGDG